MVELIDGFETQEPRSVAVGFEGDGREEGRLEAVRAALVDDAAKASQGGASAQLLVVGQRVQVALNGSRRPQLSDEPALAGREAASCQPSTP